MFLIYAPLTTAFFTLFHFCCFSFVRYSNFYSQALPKWSFLLRALSLTSHYCLDWFFCFGYIGIGIYVGYKLFNSILTQTSLLLFGFPFGIALVVLVFNSLLYLIALYSGSSNSYLIGFIQEYPRILISDLIVLIVIFYLVIASLYLISRSQVP